MGQEEEDREDECQRRHLLEDGIGGEDGAVKGDGD